MNYYDIVSDNSFYDIHDDNELLSVYDSYVSDISMLDIVDDNEKELLLLEIIEIINRLNNIFDDLGCNDEILGKGRKPWIDDKVVYCFKHYDNNFVLDELKCLYDKYVDVRNKFLEGYLKLVIFIAYLFVKEGSLEVEELIQYGNIGLIRAIELYDLKFNTRFSTYASKWICQSIIGNSKKVLYTIRKPLYLFKLNNIRIRAINYLGQELGRMPSNKEIAEYTGLSLDKVNMLMYAFLDVYSLDEPIETSIDSVYINRNDDISYKNYDLENEVINNCMISELKDCIEVFLSDKEKFVIYNKYYKDMSFFDISLLLGLTPQRISQIHTEAIKKLRKKSRIKKIEDYLR